MKPNKNLLLLLIFITFSLGTISIVKGSGNYYDVGNESGEVEGNIAADLQTPESYFETENEEVEQNYNAADDGFDSDVVLIESKDEKRARLKREKEARTAELNRQELERLKALEAQGITPATATVPAKMAIAEPKAAAKVNALTQPELPEEQTTPDTLTAAVNSDIENTQQRKALNLAAPIPLGTWGGGNGNGGPGAVQTPASSN